MSVTQFRPFIQINDTIEFWRQTINALIERSSISNSTIIVATSSVPLKQGQFVKVVNLLAQPTNWDDPELNDAFLGVAGADVAEGQTVMIFGYSKVASPEYNYTSPSKLYPPPPNEIYPTTTIPPSTSPGHYIIAGYVLGQNSAFIGRIPDAEKVIDIWIAFNEHVAAEDPHPQYTKKTDIDIESIILTAKKQSHPVGSVFVTSDSRNPSAILGFGSWEQIKGRFVVGVDDQDAAFNPVNQIGGSKNRALVVDNIPAHNHLVFSADGTYKKYHDNNPQAQAPYLKGAATDGSNDDEYNFSVTTVAPTRGATTNVGSGTQFSILPPYISKYMWERLPDPEPTGSGSGFDPNNSSGVTLE